jgi:hypothetical protein
VNCYVCAVAGAENGAVGICGVGSVGRCVKHLGENAGRRGLRGAHPDDCLHYLGYREHPPPITRIPIRSGGRPPTAAWTSIRRPELPIAQRSGSSQLGLRNASSELFILRFSRGLTGSFLLSALLGSGLGVSVAVDGSTGGGSVADTCRLPSHPRPWYEDPGKARLKTMGPLPGTSSFCGRHSVNQQDAYPQSSASGYLRSVAVAQRSPAIAPYFSFPG